MIKKNNFIWIAYTEIREQWEINGFFGTITSTSIARGKFDRKKIDFYNVSPAENIVES